MKEKYVAFNILSMVGQDSTFEQLSKSMESDEIEKAIGHKYFKREGTPGNYKYYYTEADWKNRNSIGSGEKDVEISVGDKIIGSEGVTKNRTGRVTSINGDMAQVDFGGGDKYGITLRRIKEGEFKQVKGDRKPEFVVEGTLDPTKPDYEEKFSKINWDKVDVTNYKQRKEFLGKLDNGKYGIKYFSPNGKNSSIVELGKEDYDRNLNKEKLKSDK